MGGGLGFGRGLGLALAEVVVVAAVVFLDPAVGLDDQGAGHDVVEEGPVVADQQDRPLILDQQAFEQLQRLDVEVVGRLVQDQHVRRPGEQLGQQEPAPLAAGEELDQAPRPLGREEEVLEVADDVPGLAVDRDRVVRR